MPTKIQMVGALLEWLPRVERERWLDAAIDELKRRKEEIIDKSVERANGRMIAANLTNDEKRAINTLKRLAEQWPKSLWLFSANGTLEVMRCNEDGDRVFNAKGSVDQGYIVTDISIPNDGGDW